MSIEPKFEVGQKAWYTDYGICSTWETNLYYDEIIDVEWSDDYAIYMYRFKSQPAERIDEAYVSDSPKNAADAVGKAVKEEIRIRRNMLSEFKKNVMKAINEHLKEREANNMKPQYHVGDTVWFIVDGKGSSSPKVETRRIDKPPITALDGNYCYIIDGVYFLIENMLYPNIGSVLAAYRLECFEHIRRYVTDAEEVIKYLTEQKKEWEGMEK